jgi:AAA family ATP:ADP antiporter
MGLLGLGLAGISLAAVPISLVWLVNGLWLGRRNEALAREASRHQTVEAVRRPHLTTP